MPSPVRKLFSPKFLFWKAIRITHNAYWDWRFGGSCGGQKISSFPGANATQSSEYMQLRLLFKPERLPISQADVLVDAGCGKGRVINYWLMCGYRNRMIGIEVDEEIANLARKRLKKYPNVTIITGNVLDNLPADATKFYLWNSFQAEMMMRFKARLLDTYRQRGDVTLIYYNCEELHAFEDDPSWIIERVEGEVDLAFPSAIIRMNARLP
jgi:hypothetical protein